MTRQQRRKMERDMKKGITYNQRVSEPVVYGSTLVDWDTFRTTGNTLGSFLSPEDIFWVKRNDSVCESTLLVDIVNEGRESTSIVRIIHDSEEYGFNQHLIQNLLMKELHTLIHSSENKSPKTLNEETVFTLVMCMSSMKDSQILNHLSDYVRGSIQMDVDRLCELHSNLKKVG
jgi:hypothetical protein